MDEIKNNPLDSSVLGSASDADRSITQEETGVSIDEFRETWAGAEAAMAQGMIFYMFPEARKIQERADRANREMLKDN